MLGGLLQALLGRNAQVQGRGLDVSRGLAHFADHAGQAAPHGLDRLHDTRGARVADRRITEHALGNPCADIGQFVGLGAQVSRQSGTEQQRIKAATQQREGQDPGHQPYVDLVKCLAEFELLASFFQLSIRQLRKQ